MQEAFVDINKIPTKVITLGRWITQKPKSDENEIILIIPGNPGCTGFYKPLMNILYKKHKCPVWVIGYTGHEEPKQKNTPDIELIGLKEQIRQKVTFIEEYVPRDVKLYVVGHSIGSYMTLQLLKEPSIEKRIAGTYLLFPTFEKLLETPNGWFLNQFGKIFEPFILLFAWFFSVLPKVISMNLLKFVMILKNIPLEHQTCLYEMMKPSIMKQIFYLSFQELDQLRERDDENIKRNMGRVCFLYGESDKWAPKYLYENIKRDLVNIEARMSDFEHAFVFHFNEEVAEIVHRWICKSI